MQAQGVSSFKNPGEFTGIYFYYGVHVHPPYYALA
jgi:hypothetical protein